MSFSFFFFFRRPGAVDKVYPLSLLSFVAAAHSLSLSRRPPWRLSGRETEEKEEVVRGGGTRQISQVTGLDHVFRRHVKPKKQHEIKNLAKVCWCSHKCRMRPLCMKIAGGHGDCGSYWLQKHPCEFENDSCDFLFSCSLPLLLYRTLAPGR